MKPSLLISRGLGIVGMGFLIVGNFFPPSTARALCFIAGCLFLLVPPAVEFNLFFICLQLVALSGAVMYFIEIPLILKATIPLSVFAVFSIYFYRAGLIDKLTAIGVLGVGFLALGYGLIRAEIYFFGGLLLTIYSWLSFRQGVTIALMWAITNTFFTLAASYAIIQAWN